MPVITYTAKRALATDHVIGVEYSIEFDAARIDRSASTERKEHRALGGVTEVLRYRHDTFWQLTASMVLHTNLILWREFYHSVDGGEPFTLDAYGSLAAPDNPISVMLDGNSYVEDRVNESMFYNITFRAREL